jgi:hypothetical protein
MEFRNDPGRGISGLAKDVRARAAKETDLRTRTEWENLALMYARLAKQANSSVANSSVEDDPVNDLLNRTRH